MTRVRRALLFMPGGDRRKIEKGIAAAPDSIILDLEDGVALNRKAEARAAAAAALVDLDFGRAERLVRINPLGSGLAEADLAALLPAHPDGLVIPKVESPEQIDWVRRRSPRGTALLAIVESAKGIVNLKAIAAAKGLTALVFGAEDLIGSVGGVRTKAGAEVHYARSTVITHAAAFDLSAIDTPYIDLNDEAGLRAETRSALELGYSGKLAIHPKQLAPILDVFTPSPDEVARARRLVEAYAQYQAEGLGVFALEGTMIDAPLIRAARAVLARAGIKENDPS